MTASPSTKLMPSDVKQRITYALGRAYPNHYFAGYVRVSPQDENGRRPAAWCARRYEVLPTRWPQAIRSTRSPACSGISG